MVKNGEKKKNYDKYVFNFSFKHLFVVCIQWLFFDGLNALR